MNKKSIEKILEEYKYGRYNFLDEDFRIIETQTKFKLNNFFKRKEKTGDCIELAQDLYENKELYEHVDVVYKVKGSKSPKSKMFTEPNSHMFLITPPQELKEELKKMNDYEKVIALSRTNFGVIDPSFKLVSDRNTTAYRINTIINENLEKEKNMVFFKPYGMAKVAISIEDNRLFNLISDDSELQLETNDNEYKSLEGLNINTIPNLNGSAEILTSLQEKYMNRIKK